MIKNLAISAWRNMIRSKLYTAINIFCLTLGISGAILIMLYLNHELSHDKHHENHKSIFLLNGIYTLGESDFYWSQSPLPLGPAMKLEFKEVREFVRFFNPSPVQMVKIGDEIFNETKMLFADSTVFDVFTHKFIHGSPGGALSEPNTAVLTRSLSNKFFGDINPLGKVFEISGNNYKVTAMIEDLPDNSHLKFSALLAIHSNGNPNVYSVDPNLFWNIRNNYTYLMMHQGSDIFSMLNDMDSFNEKYLSHIGKMINGTVQYRPVALRETHFNTAGDAGPTGSRKNLMIFSMVAIFLIAIAAVNYTNLATARASYRAREIALRKVCGANQGQIIFQFISESLIVAFFSLALSLMIVEWFLPGFNLLANKSFSFSHLLNFRILPQVILITIFTGFAAGIYPAFFLSRMKPVSILKATRFSKSGSAFLRKILVIFQFVISLVLISSTLVVWMQLNFLQNKNLGFDTENKLVASLNGLNDPQLIESLGHIMMQNPMIAKASLTSFTPGKSTSLRAVKVDSHHGMADATVCVVYVDTDYLDLMQVDLLQGRNFYNDSRGDVNQSIIINESAAKTFGWNDNPLGKQIHYGFNQQGQPVNSFSVVGVIRDFNILSLHNPIGPLMLLLPEQPETYRAMLVEHSAGMEKQVREFIENKFLEINPHSLPQVFPLTQGFSEEFSAEQKLGKIFGIFAIVCILISFLGLFGLASFSTTKRQKEVGVRKILGASANSILKLFYKDFFILVLIAFLVAAPLSWYLMQQWLNSFYYRVNMSLMPILMAGVFAILVAFFTVSYHTYMASRMNPADAVRSE
jgi:putative ABC transport system permease protein